MASGDAQPTLPLPDPLLPQTAAEPAAPRRRVRWPWIIAIVLVVVVAVGFLAEMITRQVVTSQIGAAIATELDLPEGHPVDVDIPGLVLPQIVTGSIAEITLASDDVPLGDLAADVTVHATGVPVSGGEIGSATATVRLDQAQLTALLAQVPDFPADSVKLEAPDVAVATSLSVFGTRVPLGVSLTPGATEGELVLTPTSFDVGGAAFDAEKLQDQFGAVANLVVRDWSVCIADRLPQAATLTDVAVAGDQLVATFAVDPAVMSDPALRENGTCS